MSFMPRRTGREAMLALYNATAEGQWVREERFMSAGVGKTLSAHDLAERSSGTGGRSGVPAQIRLTGNGRRVCRLWLNGTDWQGAKP